jgi:23S rRNA pseudouridine2605 synthase
MNEGTRLIRLNKTLAFAGVCSRRRADELIAAGVVCVNGIVADELGQRIDPRADTITVHGKPVVLPSDGMGSQRHVYVMLHKPIQVVSTVKEPEGRPAVLDFLSEELRKSTRLYPVGRLDYFSEGLLLLTDDGELTNRLTHPRYHLPKRYQVRVRERVENRMLEIMQKGMTLREGERLAPVEAEVQEDNILLLTLRQGINRQIRRMCRDLGLTILSLRRISLGPLCLGDLPKGRCRVLLPDEVAALKKSVGL